MSEAVRLNRPTPPLPLTREQVIEWLDYQLESLSERRSHVLDAMTAMLEAGPVITDARTAGVYAENVRMATALERSAKTEIDAAKRPYIDGGKAVDGWRNAYMLPLQDAVREARARLLAWEQRQTALARAEVQARANEAAERADAERQRVAQAQVQHGLFSPVAAVLGEAAEQAARAALEAQQAVSAKSATLSRTLGHYGAQASIRTVWTHRLVDLAAVPLAYHALDDAKVKAVMRTLPRDPQSGRPLQDIPGLEWVAEETVTVR
jgi:hypothetical protein